VPKPTSTSGCRRTRWAESERIFHDALDPVDRLVKKHYAAIRGTTFHAEVGALLPGELKSTEPVHKQLRIFQTMVADLLNKHFGAAFRSSGMIPYALDLQLKSLIPSMCLATSPIHVSDLVQEIRSALTSTDYYDTLPKTPEDITPSRIGKLTAQERFSFDLVHITLDVKRPGYDSEWTLTAKAHVDKLQNSQLRSMALFYMRYQTTVTDPFLLRASNALTSKVISADLDITGDG
jgi:hypothetical protein